MEKTTSKKQVKMLELTPKQQKFVDIFIEKGHLQSAKQCAIDAGYAESGATVNASQLQNPKYYPHVVAEMDRRRAELARRYSITYKSHVQKLAELETQQKQLVITLELLLPKSTEVWWLAYILTGKKSCMARLIKCL